MDRVGAAETHIEFVKAPGNKVTFENLEITTPTGCTMLSEQYVQIALGERVVIVGAPGTGKTLLFLAIAGLWPWGSGRVALPSIRRCYVRTATALCTAGNIACSRWRILRPRPLSKTKNSPLCSRERAWIVFLHH